MDEQNYTSLELSKKLKKNGFKYSIDRKDIVGPFHTKEVSGWKLRPYPPFLNSNIKGVTTEYYKAYDILNDICVKYAKEFFGEEDVCKACGEAVEKNYDEGVCKNCCGMLDHDSNGPGDMDWVFKYKYVTKVILGMLQQTNKDSVETHIWHTCKFNPQNK